jgi:hypothetical protein
MIEQTTIDCPMCADCPMFEAFEGDTRRRGLCKLFDKVARGYHPMTSDCENQLDEVEVVLYSHEIDTDDAGNLIPASIEILSIFLPHGEVNRENILKQFQRYADQFREYYLADWQWFNDPNCEF